MLSEKANKLIAVLLKHSSMAEEFIKSKCKILFKKKKKDGEQNQTI